MCVVVREIAGKATESMRFSQNQTSGPRSPGNVHQLQSLAVRDAEVKVSFGDSHTLKIAHWPPVRKTPVLLRKVPSCEGQLV